MKKYDEIISGLKNQKAEFNQAGVWYRIQNSISGEQSQVKIWQPYKLIPAMALCALVLGFGLNSLNHSANLDPFLNKVGNIATSPDYFYENTEYNRELL